MKIIMFVIRRICYNNIEVCYIEVPLHCTFKQTLLTEVILNEIIIVIVVMHLSMLSPRVGGGGAGYPQEID